jgi:hypothetical protein
MLSIGYFKSTLINSFLHLVDYGLGNPIHFNSNKLDWVLIHINSNKLI